jgi:hypothetical protein
MSKKESSVMDVTLPEGSKPSTPKTPKKSPFPVPAEVTPSRTVKTATLKTPKTAESGKSVSFGTNETPKKASKTKAPAHSSDPIGEFLSSSNEPPVTEEEIRAAEKSIKKDSSFGVAKFSEYPVLKTYKTVASAHAVPFSKEAEQVDDKQLSKLEKNQKKSTFSSESSDSSDAEISGVGLTPQSSESSASGASNTRKEGGKKPTEESEILKASAQALPASNEVFYSFATMEEIPGFLNNHGFGELKGSVENVVTGEPLPGEKIRFNLGASELMVGGTLVAPGYVAADRDSLDKLGASVVSLMTMAEQNLANTQIAASADATLLSVANAINPANLVLPQSEVPDDVMLSAVRDIFDVFHGGKFKRIKEGGKLEKMLVEKGFSGAAAETNPMAHPASKEQAEANLNMFIQG